MFINIVLALITVWTATPPTKVMQLEYYFSDRYTHMYYNEHITTDGTKSLSYLESLHPFEGAMTRNELDELVSDKSRFDEWSKIVDGGKPIQLCYDYNVKKKNCEANFYIIQDQMDAITYRIQIIKGAPSFREINYLVRDSIRNEGWTLHDEYKDIEGRQCRKVTTTFRCKSLTGWVDMSVPVSKGPDVFREAPGLIVQLRLDDGYQQWSLKSFKQVEDNTLSQRVEAALADIQDCKALSREDTRLYFEKYKKDIEKHNNGDDCLNCMSTITVVVTECFEDMEEEG